MKCGRILLKLRALQRQTQDTRVPAIALSSSHSRAAAVTHIDGEDECSGDSLDAHDGQASGEGANESVHNHVSLLDRVLEEKQPRKTDQDEGNECDEARLAHVLQKNLLVRPHPLAFRRQRS